MRLRAVSGRCVRTVLGDTMKAVEPAASRERSASRSIILAVCCGKFVVFVLLKSF